MSIIEAKHLESNIGIISYHVSGTKPISCIVSYIQNSTEKPWLHILKLNMSKTMDYSPRN